MLKLHKINRTNNAYRLLNKEKNKISVSINDYTEIIPSNNSKFCKNKYKNIGNLHNIIHSSVLKSYKNAYFYKNMLKVAENKQNELNLHQINTILKSLIKAQIYKYSLFHSFQIPILRYINSITCLIHKIENTNIHTKKESWKEKINQDLNNNVQFTNNLCKKLHLNLSKYKIDKPNVDINLYIISDQINILIDIFNAYMHVLNFRFNYLCNTLFFFITKNYIYINEKDKIANIWSMYILIFMSRNNIIQTNKDNAKIENNKDVYNSVNKINSHKIGNSNQIISYTKNCSNMSRTISLTKKANKIILYRYKHICNINIKTVYNYNIIVYKNNRKNKVPYYNKIFCRNNIISLCKYIILIFLKNQNIDLSKKKKICVHMENINNFISNGYMYKLINSKTPRYSQIKYLIKYNYIENPILLTGKYFPIQLLRDNNFLLNLLNRMIELRINSNICRKYIKKICETLKK
ncbi:conserved Plasmodium protein, unknown function [Plasmodium berghei]|uniref:Uncharacterized protein n=2 Tax=Plasmodium berghei TaxID=5821 RepID=A0A509AHR3_PLABA|nr:conserved Plasmodium protein, unknown function [Plasmodium berghei ANKA]CXI17237.1 conserved Plasmodium protein, unknown function [Plasmodium berghei]SCM19686.1 conserved Plasmodium protein, unknown function [Plasmodium berghei]SCN23429.1 conserved Plasmodium protein, unknown function [Plasmodium berghei]SCO59078.1 conserved Plasmodium protein, unknown function [Plasmodium berghei]SCO59714.1 conserved Plasmodium protein, unknown function [Plasmodium berghei]|eukprot:XP_034420591.1 conserved Plasmodium protein, unknown function [Plasmodium berghei ANKA]